MEAKTAHVFCHELVREAAYQLQLPTERGRLHAYALDLSQLVLDGATSDTERLAILIDVARHAREAARCTDFAGGDQIELGCLIEAAEIARRRHDVSTAASVLSRIVQHATASPTQRTSAHVTLAEVLRSTGRGVDAEEQLQAAIDLGREHGLVEIEGRARATLVNVLVDLGRPHEALAQADTCMTGRFDGMTPVFYASLRGTRAGVLRLLGRESEASEGYRTAISELRKLGDLRALGRMLNDMSQLPTLLKDFAGRRTLLDEALALARRTNDLRLEGIVLTELAVLLHEAGDRGAVAEQIQKALKIQRELGDRRTEGVTLALWGGMNIGVDNGHEAAELLRAALAILLETGAINTAGSAYGNLGLALVELGDMAGAEVALNNSIRMLESAASVAHAALSTAALARVHLFQGRIEGAQAMLDAADEFLDVPGFEFYRAKFVGLLRVRLLCARVEENANAEILLHEARGILESCKYATGYEQLPVESADRLEMDRIELVIDGLATRRDSPQRKIWRGHLWDELTAALRDRVVNGAPPNGESPRIDNGKVLP